MTDEPKDVLGRIARRSRDLMAVVAIIMPVVAALMAFIYWQVEDSRFHRWVARVSGAELLGQTTERLTNELRHVTSSLDALTERINHLEKDMNRDLEPILVFSARGHRISDVRVGEWTDMTWTVTKMRDCGPPYVAAWYRNGDERVHTFVRLSNVDSSGRASPIPPEPRVQIYRFSAMIPAEEPVHPGTAYGWIELQYLGCPGSPLVRSPEVPFAIMERAG